MNISYSWLKRFLPVQLDPKRVDELLTDTGLEVEGVTEIESIRGGLRGVVVGEVLTCVQHPNADRLKITTVEIGANEPIQIVCGAPNVAAGQKVPVATVGTILYPNGEELKIKKGKIRGEISLGMICAESELGLGQGADGIMVLEETILSGTACSEVFNVQSDYVFEIGLTPNRTDAMGHIGVARDLRAALLTLGESAPELYVPNEELKSTQPNTIELYLEDSDCPSYSGIHFTNVQVAESPNWLKANLTAIGLTPKNNVVDITNYVLHTFGHPLHAFDAHKLTGQKVMVRSAHKGEKLTTLDDLERELSENDLVIADAENPICLAGVMGGKDSSVNYKTTSIYLEGAYFDAVRVRKMAKRHGINSDASYRYERGVDPNATTQALVYAAHLICEFTGASASAIDHKGQVDFPCQELTFSYNKVSKLIGIALPIQKAKEILESLEFEIISMIADAWTVKIPTYRVDVTRDVDVAEELLRIYGFNNIPVPDQMRISVAKHDPRPEKLEHSFLNQLTGNGFYEIMNNSLSKGENYQILQPEVSESLIEMLNPLSQDLNVMRGTMLFGALEAISFNQKRQQPSLRFFERGKTYGQGAKGYYETSHIDLAISGKTGEHHWTNSDANNDFFELKGIIEATLVRFGLKAIYTTSTHSLFGESVDIKVGKTKVGYIGNVHPKVLHHFDIKGSVAYSSLNWDTIISMALIKGTQLFVGLPKSPSVRRDLALLVDEATSYNDLQEVVLQTERKLLKNVFLFDVYQGDRLPADKKSYAIGMTFQDAEKTLNDKAVEKCVQRILQQLNERLGAVLR